MEHKLKTTPIFFADAACGAKTFEIRKNDRNFQVGDFLRLEEYDPSTKKYTGDWVLVTVSYTINLYGIPDLPNGFIGMVIEKV